MALVKKGSRLITVDGVGYRWRVRGRPTYSQGIGQAGLTVAVERVDQNGSVLVVTMPHGHPSGWLTEAAVPVLPSAVAALVRKALAQGWQSTQPGSAIHLDAATADLPAE